MQRLTRIDQSRLVCPRPQKVLSNFYGTMRTLEVISLKYSAPSVI